MKTKDLIREELEKLSKEDLINILTEIFTFYLIALMNNKVASANYIRECVRDVHTTIQPHIDDMTQELKVNFKKEEK